MADKELDGTDVVRQFLGERQRVIHQTRNPLSQGVVETFDIIRFAGLLNFNAVVELALRVMAVRDADSVR